MALAELSALDQNIVRKLAPSPNEGAVVNPALGRLLITDGLTGLYNRGYFDQRLRLELNAATADAPLGLFVIDLNGFKAFNDRYGHQVGDRALQEVAAAMRQVGPPAGAACRLGGDEFALLVPRSAPEDAAWLQKELAEAISRRRIPPGEGMAPIWLSGSVGLALAPRDGTDAQTLFARADAAMYAAKRQSQLGRTESTVTDRGQAPLVGRDYWVAEGAHLLGQVATAGGQFLFINGPPGVGKTRLARELAERAQAAGFLVVSSTVGPGTPLAAVRQCSVALLANAARSKARWLTRRNGAVARVLGMAPATPVPDQEQNVLGQVAQGLRSLMAMAQTSHPLFWVLDDFRMADRSTFDILHHLTEALPPLRAMVVAVARTEVQVVEDEARKVADWWDNLKDQAGCHRWELPPLDAGSTADLARWAWGGEVPADLQKSLFSRTGGNPLYVLRLAAGASDSVPEGQADLDLPGVYRAELRAMAEPTKSVLFAAATLGYEFPEQVWREVVPEDYQVAERELRALIAGGWLQRTDDRLGFCHPLGREVAYQECPPAVRRTLHRLAGRILSSRATHPPADTARHFDEGGDWLRARDWYRTAGQAAEATCALTEAAGYYRRCLHLSQATGAWPADAHAVATRAGQLYIIANETAPARDILQLALQLAGSDQERVAAIMPLTLTLSRHTQMAAMATLNQEALRILRPLGPSPELMQALCQQVGVAVNHGQSGVIPDLLQELLFTASAASDPVAAVRWIAGAGVYLGSIDDQAGMTACLAAAEERLTVLPRQCTPLLARAWINVAMVAANLGRITRAVALSRLAFRLARASGDVMVSLHAKGLGLEWQICLGKLVEARAELTSVESLFARSRNRYVHWLRLQSEACLYSHDLDMAAAFVERALQMHVAFIAPGHRAYLELLAGRIRAARGQAVTTERWSLAHLPAKSEFKALAAPACLHAAELHLHSGDLDAARQAAAGAVSADGSAMYRPWLLWLEGSVLTAGGDSARAQAAFTTATATPGHAYYRALAHRDLARLLQQQAGVRPVNLATSRLIEHHVREARQLFLRMGNHFEAERLNGVAEYPAPASRRSAASATG